MQESGGGAPESMTRLIESLCMQARDPPVASARAGAADQVCVRNVGQHCSQHLERPPTRSLTAWPVAALRGPLVRLPRLWRQRGSKGEGPLDT